MKRSTSPVAWWCSAGTWRSSMPRSAQYRLPVLGHEKLPPSRIWCVVDGQSIETTIPPKLQWRLECPRWHGCPWCAPGARQRLQSHTLHPAWWGSGERCCHACRRTRPFASCSKSSPPFPKTLPQKVLSADLLGIHHTSIVRPQQAFWDLHFSQPVFSPELCCLGGHIDDEVSTPSKTVSQAPALS